MKRFLCINICLFVLSCSSYPTKNKLQKTVPSKTLHNYYFSDIHKDYVYKANIEVYGKSFGGLLIIKKIENNNHRVAFTTEMGSKLFDFSFTKEAFTINYILDALNKKILINTLKKDFKVLITEYPETTNTYTNGTETIYETSINKQKHYFFETENLYKIIYTKKSKEKTLFLFKDNKNAIANQIEILHNNIKLKINLKSITK